MKKKSCTKRCSKAFLFFDLFGYRIGFNVDSEESHTTIAGSVMSLFIFAWLLVVLRYLIISIVQQNTDRPLTTRVLENYYGPDLTPLTVKQGFKFAIGLSSVQAFQNDN